MNKFDIAAFIFATIGAVGCLVAGEYAHGMILSSIAYIITMRGDK